MGCTNSQTVSKPSKRNKDFAVNSVFENEEEEAAA